MVGLRTLVRILYLITRIGAKTHTPNDLTRLLFLEILPTLVCMPTEQPHLLSAGKM